MKPPAELELIVCGWNGKAAHCIYLNEFRIAGRKPWGGGTTTAKFKVKREHLLKALSNSSAQS